MAGYNFRIILSLTLCLILIGCKMNDAGDGDDLRSETPALTLDQLQNTSYTETSRNFGKYDLKTANHYVSLKVKGQSIPTGVGVCNEAVNGLWKGFKNFSGVTEDNEFLITSTIRAKGKEIRKDIPILFIGKYEPDGNEGTRCVSWFNSTRITEFFRSDMSVAFDIEYSIYSKESTQVNTLSKILELVNKSSFGATSSIPVVSAWTNQGLKDIAESFELAISAGFTTSNSTTSTVTLPQRNFDNYYDKFELDISKISPSLNNAKIAIELEYQKSVIGQWDFTTSKVVYPNDPFTLLSLVTSYTGNNSSISEQLDSGAIGVTPTSLGSLEGKDDLNKIRGECRKLNEHFSYKIPLSEDDHLVIMWAIMKEYSNYDYDAEIRNDRCFTETVKGSTQGSDIDRLKSLNPDFTFRYIHTNATWNSTLKRIRAKMSSRVDMNEIFEVNNFEILVLDNTILPSPPEGKNSWASSGQVGAKNLLELVQYPECSFASISTETGKNDYSITATNLRVLDYYSRGKNKPQKGYFNQNENVQLYIIPAVIYFQPNEKEPKIRKVILGNMRLIRHEANVPDTWPENISTGLCEHYLRPNIVTVGNKKV
ncbi:hypothetical protein ACPV47_11760 [Vibrio jasicida]|uniref:hypothetical protein n=1 Tax=Vibrio jasicida TaxID=766224 RepID=UPI004067626F